MERMLPPEELLLLGFLRPFVFIRIRGGRRVLVFVDLVVDLLQERAMLLAFGHHPLP